jgi:hypothetical protein
MQCEICQQRVATIHLKGSKTVAPHSGKEERIEQYEQHFCDECGSKHVQGLLHPPLEAGSRRETVRVMSVSPAHTILRLVRTEGQTTPEDWSLLTSRLGTQLPVGEEVQMTFTESELEWLRGKRELP